MIKKKYGSGSGIREQKRNTKGRKKGEEYINYTGRIHTPGPDKLLSNLMIPLPKEIQKQIEILNKKRVPRSKIAKQLGIPKVYVTQALVKGDVGA